MVGMVGNYLLFAYTNVGIYRFLQRTIVVIAIVKHASVALPFWKPQKRVDERRESFNAKELSSQLITQDIVYSHWRLILNT